MTFLVRVSLGKAPGPREKADAQCIKFRAMLRQHLPEIDGLSLLLVQDVETGERRVEAVYSEGDRLAEAGAKEALGMAGDVWGVIGKTATRELVR